jgi:hypothetical protein
MASPSGLPVSYWLTAISNLLYRFQERPDKAALEALLGLLKGYQEAVEGGMSIPRNLPGVSQEATSRASWWEMQLQEAVTMFRIAPSSMRLANVEEMATQYMSQKTKRNRP